MGSYRAHVPTIREILGTSWSLLELIRDQVQSPHFEAALAFRSLIVFCRPLSIALCVACGDIGGRSTGEKERTAAGEIG